MSRIIKKLISEKEQNLTVNGDHVEYATVMINGDPVNLNDFTLNDILDKYTVDQPEPSGYVPVERIPSVYSVGTPGTFPSTYEYDLPQQYTKGRVAVVKRAYKEAIFDYSQENLTRLEQSGAKPYAQFKDGTFRQVEWSEVFDPNSNTGAATVNIAEIAAAHNQHFWLDTNGAHVTSDTRSSWDDEYDERNHGTLANPSVQNPWHNILLNSLGILLRRGLINLVGIAKDNISFYDGISNTADHITATFGTGGAQIGKNTENHMVLTSEGIACYDSNGNLIPVQASNISINEARIRDLSAVHASILDGMITNLTATDITTMGISANDLNATRANIRKLESGTISANELQALNGFINNFSSLRITTDYLNANYATISRLESDFATIAKLESDYIDAETLAADYATLAKLESDYIDADTLASTYATITSLQADEANINVLKSLSLAALYGDIDSLTAEEISTLNMNAINAAIQNLETDHFTTENLTAITGLIDLLRAHRITTDILQANYAEIGLANVNNAWIENGVIKRGAITDAQIQGVSANKLTAGEINADDIIVRNLQAANLKVGRINGNPVIGGYEVISTSLNGYSSKNPVNEGWYEFVNGAYVLSQDTTTRQGVTYYKTADKVELYDQAAIDRKFNDVDARIDSQIETWTGTTVPLLTNYPANQWNADTRADHVGDIYYVINSGNQYDGFTYRFAYDNTQQSYKWVLIRDNAVTDAISRIGTAESNIGTLTSFKSDTETWIRETDEELEQITSNHTNLVTKVDKTIVESIQLWYSKANSTAPAKPTAAVTSTSASGNVWTTAVPTYNKSYPNYFYCYQWKYADGTYGWSSVTHDVAMDESQSVARAASSSATAANDSLASYITSNNLAVANLDNKIDNTYEKIQSQGIQLVTNGNGFMRDNTNWPELTFDGTHANTSPGSFTRSPLSVDVISDDYFPIDPSKDYLFEFDAMSEDGTARLYSFINMFDNDKNKIAPGNVYYFPNTLTTLAQDLNPGDTVIKLTDATNWANTSTASQRSIIFWDYTNSSGYLYPPLTYSRNSYLKIYEDDSKVDKAAGTITLKTAWTGPKKLAGTQLSQNRSGGYVYAHINVLVPDTWTHYSCIYSGLDDDYNGFDTGHKFRQATAFGKVGFLWNYGHSSSAPQGQLWITNISVKEANVTHSEINELQQSLQNQIDEQVDIWYYNTTPTTSNSPFNTWTDTETKDKHVGDLYFDTSKGYSYRLTKSGSTYSWTRIKDDDINSALSAANTAQTTADNKRRVFTSQPTVPYDIGDLWVSNTNGEVRYANKARTSGSFTVSEWSVTATDDSSLASYIETNNQAVNDLSDKIDDISIGGRNLLIWDRFEKSQSSIINYDKASNKRAIKLAESSSSTVVASSKELIDIVQNNNIKNDDIVTVSFKAVATGVTNFQMDFYPDNLFTGAFGGINVNVTTEPKRYSYSGTFTSYASQLTSCVMRFFRLTSVPNYQITIWDVKWETGNKPTDWTPAPEDIYSEISIETAQRKASYGTCSTGASTQTKEVICSNFEYSAGNSLTVYFSTANTYAAGAVKLNVNDQGAKDIIVANETTSVSNQLLWGAGAYITFRYTGSAFVAINEPRVWYGLSNTAASTAAKTDTTACTGAVICKGASVVLGMTYDNTNTAPTLNIQSTGAKPIYIGPGTTRPTKDNAFSWLPNTTVKFDFDGTSWRIGGDTYIKGDHIITGTIDASQVNVTNIDAENITVNKIKASQLAVTDMTNYNQLNEATASAYGFTVEQDSSASKTPWFVPNTLTRGYYPSEWFDCRGGESFRIAAEVSSSAQGASTNGGSTIIYAQIRVGVHTLSATNSQDRVSYNIVTSSSSAPATYTSGVITISSNAVKFRAFISINAYAPFSGNFKIRKFIIERMSNGELIVDGSVTADKIAATSLTVGKFTTDAQNSILNSKYFTNISGGVKLHPSGGSNTDYATLGSAGMEIFKGGNSVASFGDIVRVGPTTGQRIEQSSNSFVITNAYNNAFAEIVDLNSTTNANPTVEESFMSDGSTTYTLSNPIAQLIEVRKDRLNVLSATYSGSNITLTSTPAKGSIISVRYKPSVSSGEWGNYYFTQYYTFGYRDHSSLSVCGNMSTAFGYLNEAGGAGSFVAGDNNSVTGKSSVSFGASNTCIGNYSIASGLYNYIYSNYSSAFGYYLNTISSASKPQFVIGQYNKTNNKDLFEIGNGSAANNRANAFRVTTDNTAYVGSTAVTSDIRVKSDIEDLDVEDAYEFISSLKPKSYKKFNRPELGFIAQDVEPLIYGDILVDESPNFGYDDFKNLSYEGLIAPIVVVEQGLVEDMDDIYHRVEILKAENDRLKEENKVLIKKNEDITKKNTELEARLARIEAMLGIQ